MGELDIAKAEAFAGRMTNMLNDALLGLMTSIGHQTGLFDSLGGQPPATSAEIARNAGLEERYVREWLGAMVTGGIIDYDPKGRTYHLPPEHAATVTRAGGTKNIATTMQFVGLMGLDHPLARSSIRSARCTA